jgi:hypothetical protein
VGRQFEYLEKLLQEYLCPAHQPNAFNVRAGALKSQTDWSLRSPVATETKTTTNTHRFTATARLIPCHNH